MIAPHAAHAVFKKNRVTVEGLGDDVGLEALGSPHRGLCLHHPDGYRWERSVQSGSREKKA
jgi:hypothetical protein